MSTPDVHAEHLADLFEATPSSGWLVITGAGISHASGIPTFRGTDPEAVWRQHDVEMATFGTFQRDPVAQWSWYLDRFRSLDGAQPNAAHRALVKLETLAAHRGGRLTLVTQNIDCLHEGAGSSDVVKVHGSSDRLRCSVPGCEFGAPAGTLPRDSVDLEPFRRRQSLEALPRCPACNALLRAHVLFFDEFYTEHQDYRFSLVEQAVEDCDLVLFVGTSLSVGVTDMVLRRALSRRRPVASIDPALRPRGPGLDSMIHFPAAAEEILPVLCQSLSASD